MNRIFWTIRNSLAFKVILSTVILSLGVVWITGSALNSRLSSGIREVNLNSAIVEARSTIFTADYRFLLAQGEKDSVVQKLNTMLSILKSSSLFAVLVIKLE